jgi:hypothetical protein
LILDWSLSPDALKTRNKDQNYVKTTNTPTKLEPIFKFGRIMGIFYDHDSHFLYLTDYINGQIERITFKSKESFEFDKKELLLTTTSQSQLNPIFVAIYDHTHIFWINFNEGIKSTVHKSVCIRQLFKVNDANTLRLIQMRQLKRFQQTDNNVKTSSQNRQNIEMKSMNNIEMPTQNNNDINEIINSHQSDGNIDQLFSNNGLIKPRLQLPMEYYLQNQNTIQQYNARKRGMTNNSICSISLLFNIKLKSIFFVILNLSLNLI